MTTDERKAAWIASISHGFTHGFMTLLPAVMVVLAGEQALGFFALGAVVNLGYFLFGAGSIPAGIMADRVGSQKTLTVGLYGMAASSILIGISPNSWAFALSYALLGLAASIYHPAGLSLIARHIAKKGRALSLHGIVGNIGLSVAPLFAGLMVMLFDTWRAAYLSFGVLGLLFSVIVHRMPMENEPPFLFRELFSGQFWRAALPEKRATSPAGEKKALPLSLILLYVGSIAFGFVYRGSLTFFPSLFQQDLYMVTSSEQPVMMAGLVTSIVLSVGIVGQWFGGYLSDRLKRPEWGHVLIYCLVIPALYGMSRYSNNPLLVSSVLFSLAFYGWQPLQNSLIARCTPRSSYGKGYGWNFFFIMGMGSLATAVGGYVADHFGVDRVYLLLAGVSVAALAVTLGVIRAAQRSDSVSEGTTEQVTGVKHETVSQS